MINGNYRKQIWQDPLFPHRLLRITSLTAAYPFAATCVDHLHGDLRTLFESSQLYMVEIIPISQKGCLASF